MRATPHEGKQLFRPGHLFSGELGTLTETTSFGLTASNEHTARPSAVELDQHSGVHLTDTSEPDHLDVSRVLIERGFHRSGSPLTGQDDDRPGIIDCLGPTVEGIGKPRSPPSDRQGVGLRCRGRTHSTAEVAAATERGFDPSCALRLSTAHRDCLEWTDLDTATASPTLLLDNPNPHRGYLHEVTFAS
jgi:hypothetical protein